MVINNKNFNCKNCGHPLNYKNTINIEGGINKGYIIKKQLWTCSNCQKKYIREQRADISGSIDIIYCFKT